MNKVSWRQLWAAHGTSITLLSGNFLIRRSFVIEKLRARARAARSNWMEYKSQKKIDEQNAFAARCEAAAASLEQPE